MELMLRPYQSKLINDGRAALARIKRTLAAAGINRKPRLLKQLPTGGGKTVIASFITKSHIARGGTVYFMCHRDFLLSQTFQTFEDNGIISGHIASGKWFNPFASAYVCMVPTVSSRLEKVKSPTLVIWDECHHLGAKTWAKILEAWPDATHIGLSATPGRTDGSGLDQYFDDIVCGPTVSELIELGALSDYKYYAPTTIDLAKFHTRAGDYRQDEIDAEMSKSVIIGDIVQNYAQKALKKKAVYFFTSLKNSREGAAAFNSSGFRFKHLDGDCSSWERESAARALAVGDLDGICNVDLFGEGFDLAAQAKMDVAIECVGLVRPTKSRNMSTQQRGRVLRPKPYPGIILDHASHIKTFGLPDDEVIWTLKGSEVVKTQGVLQCDDCGAQVSREYLNCPHCNGILRIPGKRKASAAGDGGREVEFMDGEMGEVDKRQYKQHQRFQDLKEQQEATTLEALIALGKKKGVKNVEAWAGAIYSARVAKGKGEQLTFYGALGK